MASETAPASTPLGSDLPSTEFVEAVSELLETDAQDLLWEMGYYERTAEPQEPAASPQ